MSTQRIKSLIAPWLVPFASDSLQRAAARRSSIPEWVELVFRWPRWLFPIAPLQIREEISALLDTLRRDPPRRVLEIGTASGGTLFLLTRVSHAEATLVSVDLPWGSGGGYRPWRQGMYSRFARPGQSVRLVQGDSHEQHTLDRIRKALQGEPVDFLLIDGDHSYEGAKRDWKMYGPLVRPGGLIAFHDIVPGPSELVGGVPHLWQELRKQHEHEELVADWEQSGCGLGLIWQRAGAGS